MGHLITGAKGQAHITPKSDAVWHRGVMGVESCILDFGEKLAPALIPSQPTNIRILDGCGMFQGRFFEIEEGSYDTIAIPNGAQGYNRIDLVCAKITQNENGTQTFSWEVVQGTQTSGTPQPPTVAEHSLDDGDEFALMPIASVELEGVNIVAVETVATISTAGEHISLDTDASEGVDKELTDSLTALGWLSSVIDGIRGMLNVKALLKNIVKTIKLLAVTPDFSATPTSYVRGGANPFTIPHDGLMCGFVNNAGAVGNSVYITINGGTITLIPSSVNTLNTGTIQIPVKQGDVVNVRVPSGTMAYQFDVFPYKSILGGTQ